MANVARRIFTMAAQRNPQPLNIATHTTTRQFVQTDIHPHHVRVKRRLDAFDPHRLYILVLAKSGTMRRAYIITHAIRRVRAQLSESLRDHGYAWDGTVLTNDTDAAAIRKRLSGAYKFSIEDLPGALNNSISDIRKECDGAVEEMIQHAAVRIRPSATWSPASKRLVPRRFLRSRGP